MTTPRRLVPDQTYMISRRVARREFRLKPESLDPLRDEVTRAFTYCLVFAALLFGIQIHAVIVLGNHYHAVVSDLETNLSRFSH